MKKALGALILALMFGCLFAAHVANDGLTTALINLAIALGVSALAILAAWLLA